MTLSTIWLIILAPYILLVGGALVMILWFAVLLALGAVLNPLTKSIDAAVDDAVRRNRR